MNQDSWPKRLHALDVTRGIAALAVVLWHWQHFAFNGPYLPGEFERSAQPFYSVFKLFYEKGLLGVEYFYLLSGFIFFWIYKDALAQKRVGNNRFWVQRFSRLYPLHLVTLLLVAILQKIYITQNPYYFVYQFNDAYHFVLNLFMATRWGFEEGWSFNAPIWSVSIEILLYIAFFVIASRRWGSPFFCLTISLASFVAIVSRPAHHPLFEGLALFFLGGFVFYATSIMATKPLKFKSIVYFVAITAWILTIINVYLFSFADLFPTTSDIMNNVFHYGFLFYILFPFTVASVALVEIDKGQFLQSLSWLGDITYSSYLLHFPLQLVFALAVSYGILKSDFYLQPIYLIIFFAILIPISYFTFIRFERPAQKFLRQKMLRKNRAQMMQESVK